MSKEEREQKVRAELSAIRSTIANGQIEEATKRLGGLSFEISPGSILAKEVGDLYWELGFPAMAGLYWYFLDEKSDEMLSACDEFQRSVGNNPIRILDAIGWPEEPSPEEPSPEVKSKLEDLQGRARDFRRQYRRDTGISYNIRDRIALLGCGVVAFLLITVFVCGVMFIVQMFH
jgi:hypothetical protein